MLEFIEETHTYLLDGKIIPSATQLLKEIFPLKYDNVPINILEKKSEYGTQVHKFIEIIEKKKPKKKKSSSGKSKNSGSVRSVRRTK